MLSVLKSVREEGDAALLRYTREFAPELALAALEAAYGRPADQVFASFTREPVASASVAQVHFAILPAEHGGKEVAVKILRPGIRSVIDQDIVLLRSSRANVV